MKKLLLFLLISFGVLLAGNKANAANGIVYTATYTYTYGAAVDIVPTVTGGTGTFVSSANLPSGLAVGTNGVITGTPTAVGTYANISIKVRIGITTYTSNTFTITISPAALTITATGPLKPYGTTITAGTSTINFTATGAVTGQTVTSVTLTPNANGASPTTAIGSAYVITPSAPTGTGGFLASNYTITYHAYNGTVTIGNLTIIANSVSKVYGATLTGGAGSTAFTTTGLATGETVGSVAIAYGTGSAATDPAATDVGQVTASAATGGSFNPANYIINYTPGTITVTKAPLTITANNQAKVYGTTFTFAGTEFTASGLLNSDAIASCTLTSAGSAAGATVAGSPYTITPSAAVGSGLTNYTITYATTGTMTVTAVPLTITATGPLKPYGTTITAGASTTNFSVTAGTLVTGENVTGVTLTPDANGASPTTPVGSAYVITPSAATGSGGFLASNYSITYLVYNGTVTTGNLTITANVSNVYGSTLTGGAGFTGFTTTGLAAGETIGSVTVAYGTGSAATDAAGVYANQTTVSAATGGSFNPANYNISYNPGTITVTPAPLTITANNQTKVYGTTFTFAGTEFTTSGLLNSDAVASCTLTSAGSAAGATVAGSPYVITPSAAVGSGLTNYTITYATTGTMTVTAVPLTITATGPAKIYGTALTTGTSTTNFTVMGSLSSGQSVTNVILTPDANGQSATTAAGTTYVVTPSGATGSGGFLASDYTITYVPYSGTVAQKTLTISATGPAKTYGTALTAGTSTTNFTAAGTVAGQTVTSVTLTPDANGLSASVAAGTAYTVTPSAPTGSGGFSAANYNITYNVYNGTVATAPLTITANSFSKVYGTAYTFSGTEFIATGLKNSDAVTSVTLTSAGAASTANAGTYSIVPSAAVGSGLSNYNIAYSNGTLTVTKIAITILATGPAKTYGTALTTGTYTTDFSVSGTLAPGQSVTSVTLTMNPNALSTTAAAGSAYVVTPSNAAGAGGFAAGNYTITYTPPYTGTIGQAPLTITANTNTKTYGSTLTNGNITTGFTSTGLKNAQTVGRVTAVYGTGSAATDPVGTYANQITISGAAGGTFTASNYSITYAQGTIVVGQATLTITANNVTKTIGNTLTGGAGSSAFTSTGLVNGETVGTVTITYGAAGAAGAAIGTYANQVVPSALTGGTFNASNYAIVYDDGSITIVDHIPAIAYNTPNVYPVNVAISTLAPTNTGGTVLAPGLNNGTNLSVTPNFNGADGMALDASGNLYVTNNNGTIDEFDSSGNFVTSFSGFSDPVGIVFDASGDAYVLDAGTDKIYEYNPGKTLINTLTVTGLKNPSAIAIDGSGNLYIANTGNNDVLEVNAGNGAIIKTITSNINAPTGVAIDNSGNLYVTNTYSIFGAVYQSTLTKYTAGVYQSTIANDYLLDFTSIAIDPSGNFYVGEGNFGDVYELNPSGTVTKTLGGFNNPEGTIVDSKGDVFVSDNANNTVTEYGPTGGYYISGPLPPGLSFSNTTGQITGTPTAAFPTTTYTVTAYNSGGAGTSNTFTISCYLSYDWVGTTSTDWNTPNNWESKAVPGATNTANIGVNVAFTNQPTVSTTGATTVNVGAIQIGNTGGKAVTLTVATGYTLAVAGDITKQSDANSTLGYTGTLAGAGSITAVNLNIIASTAATSVYTEAVASSVNSLKLSGNVSLASALGATAQNTSFSVTGGTTTLTATGLITTVNATGGASTFGVAGGTLQAANPTFLSGLSASCTNVASFKNTGATIEYSGAAQTVYTDAAVANLSNTISYQNIKFSGTGIKTPTGGNLNIAGDFNNTLANDAADYVPLTATPVFFNGTAAQNIYAGGGNGTVFNNITFNGSGATTIQSGMAYVDDAGTLTMAGSATLAAGGNLTLVSDAGGNAAVAPITSGTPISGNVNVQRYITGERGYRLLSSPVNASGTGNGIYSMNYLLNSLYVTGSGGGFTATGNPSLYLYDEGFVPQYSTFYNSNFVAISSMTGGIGPSPSYTVNVNGAGLTGSWTVPAGNGFYCFFRGNLSEGTGNLTNPGYSDVLSATVSASGTLNQGSIPFADWYSPSSTYLGAVSQNYNLVGNPYASAIDLGTVQGTTMTTGIYMTTYNSVTNTGISKFVYELNPVSNEYGVYATDGSVGATNGATQYIASGQGFFVQAFGANASQLVFNESAKATTTAANATGLMARRIAANVIPADQNPVLRLKMSADSVNYEETIVAFNPDSKATYVFNEDAPHKSGSGTVAFYSSSSDHIAMAVNTMPLQASLVIPLNVTATKDGLYTINMTQPEALPSVYQVWLRDAYKKDSLDIKDNPVYNFDILHADTNTYGNRFSLVIRVNPGLMLHLLSFNAVKLTAGDNVTWTVENEANYTHFAVQRSTDGGKTYATLDSLLSNSMGSYSYLDGKPAKGANSYRLQLTDVNGLISYSAVITIMYANTGDTIALNGMMVYPNPTNGPMNLAINVSANGSNGALPSPSYRIQVTNNLGIVVKNSTSSQPVWQTDVSALLPGTYFITVINESNNSLVGRSAFVKL